MAHFVSRSFSDDGFVISNIKGLTFDTTCMVWPTHFLDGEHQCQTFLFDQIVPMFGSDHDSTQIVDCLLVSLIIILG